MNSRTSVFTKSLVIAFALFVSFCLLPVLNIFPKLLSLLTFVAWENPIVAWFMLAVIGGMPAAGYLFVLVFANSGERLLALASWSGLWIGAIAGSLIGTNILETP